ncbi:MAG: hypothetical protein IPL73_18335 [Candidatus Obscuribacter sp.]|nr:hypothetical protein [Candidatus Obscuribacter sp.]
MNKVKVPDEEERARQFKLSLPDLEREKSIEDIFERYEAQAYSCYAGIEQPGGHNQPHGNKLLRVIPPDKLWPDRSDALIPPLGEAAHDQLQSLYPG